MSLFAWLRRHQSDERIRAIEAQLAELKRKLEESSISPIRIDNANIEKIIIEKFEHNNNFGALGVKELGGTLNIGANYSGPMTEALLKKIFADGDEKSAPGARPGAHTGMRTGGAPPSPKKEKENENENGRPGSPAWNIRSRQGGDRPSGSIPIHE